MSDLDQLTLENIIEGCRKGKDSSRKQLYDAFSDVLFAVSLRYARNYEDAKDILQDSFVTIFEKISQFESRGSFEGWMKKVVVNKALMRYRNKDNSFLDMDDVLFTQPAIKPDVIEELSARELTQLIMSLSPQYRLVFNMYALEGYSHKEIAQQLNISEGTSKSNLARARKILQDKIFELTGKKEFVL